MPNVNDLVRLKDGYIHGYAPKITNPDILDLQIKHPDKSLLTICSRYMGSQKKWHDASEYDKQMAIRRNELHGVEFVKRFGGQNRILDVFIAELLDWLTSSVNYLALGTAGYPPPSAGDIEIDAEVVRFTPTSIYNNGAYTFVFSVELLPSQAILTGNTDVATGGPYTTTVFDVDDASAISQYDQILVNTSSSGDFSYVVVTNIAGDTLTVDPALPAVPIAGDDVFRTYGNGGLIRNGTATLGTGTPCNRKIIQFCKTNELVILDGVLVFQPVTT